jgi:hypothetical protein
MELIQRGPILAKPLTDQLNLIISDNSFFKKHENFFKEQKQIQILIDSQNIKIDLNYGDVIHKIKEKEQQHAVKELKLKAEYLKFFSNTCLKNNNTV